MNAYTLWNQSHKISNHVYTKYLNQPYGFFVNNNISTLSRNILGVSITESIFLPILQIISRIIVCDINIYIVDQHQSNSIYIFTCYISHFILYF